MEPDPGFDPDSLGRLRDSLEVPVASLPCCVQYSAFALCTEIQFKYSMVVGEPMNMQPATGQSVLPIFDAGG